MNEDTKNLLRQCNAGCKSATNSIEQVRPYVKDNNLMKVIDKYDDIHIKIGDECHELLNKGNEDEKDPSMMAKVFSWVSTEMKLMIHDNTHQIADLMIDGCNMGIKSVSEYINKYSAASDESRELAKRIVKAEQEYMNELLPYL